jgi:transcriptional regulator with XRE-family HTH domain
MRGPSLGFDAFCESSNPFGFEELTVHVGERQKTKSQTNAALKVRFGVNVKNFRNRLGFSQAELAARAAMHRTYVADIERGGRNISLFSMVRLVKALRTSMAQFFLSLEAIDAAEKKRSRRAIMPKRRRRERLRPTAKKNARQRARLRSHDDPRRR